MFSVNDRDSNSFSSTSRIDNQAYQKLKSNNYVS